MKSRPEFLRPAIAFVGKLSRWRPPPPIPLDQGPSLRAIAVAVAAAFVHACVIAWGLAALR